MLIYNFRAIAVAITATSGRLGAILGNIAFGLLIDVYCVVPIYFFGCLLIGRILFNIFYVVLQLISIR